MIARYGFNELWSFVAGWAILLDYLIMIAIAAYATTDYLGGVLERARQRRRRAADRVGVIVYVGWVNMRGAGSRALGPRRPTRSRPT